MNASQFNADLNNKTKQLETYVRTEFPRMAMRKALRFIDGNFRAQGWQGRSFLPWQKNKRGGTILVHKGRLRRGTHGETAPYMVRIYNDTPYARFHNRGFNGTVNVRAFTRNKYTASQVGTGRFTKSGNERMKTVHSVAGTSQVAAHQRRVNNPRRQFMPEDPNDSPVLINAIKRDVITTIKNIFN